MSLYAIPQTAAKIAGGVIGVAVLATSANTVAILAEAVRRAVSGLCTAGYKWATSASKTNETSVKQVKNEASSVWSYLNLMTPYKSTKDCKTLGIAGLTNIAAATVTLYAAHRFCPSLVTNANNLLHNVVGIQFTPNHIPLTRLAGL